MWIASKNAIDGGLLFSWKTLNEWFGLEKEEVQEMLIMICSIQKILHCLYTRHHINLDQYAKAPLCCLAICWNHKYLVFLVTYLLEALVTAEEYCFARSFKDSHMISTLWKLTFMNHEFKPDFCLFWFIVHKSTDYEASFCLLQEWRVVRESPEKSIAVYELCGAPQCSCKISRFGRLTVRGVSLHGYFYAKHGLNSVGQENRVSFFGQISIGKSNIERLYSPVPNTNFSNSKS